MIIARNTASIEAKRLEQLAAEKLKARQVILDTMNRVRRQFITDLPAQEMIYLEKEKEALAYLALEEEPLDLTEFPFIAAEVGSTAPTAYEVAQVYVNQAALWRPIGAMLEGIRAQANAEVQAATDVAGVATAIQNLNTALEPFG